MAYGVGFTVAYYSDGYENWKIRTSFVRIVLGLIYPIFQSVGYVPLERMVLNNLTIHGTK